MYIVVVIGLMAVFPAASVVVEALLHPGTDWWMLIGKWFVFWAVGVRLMLAGVRQIAKPEFTAETIFETKDPGARKIVSELGFGNVSIGLIGLASLYWPGWIVPAAVCGGLFYGLAGLQHVRNGRRSLSENIAMVSDLFIFAVMAAFLLAMALHSGIR
jgi:hypothetical protein